MQTFRPALNLLWRTIVVGLVFSSAIVASRLILHAFGLSVPRFPRQADETSAIYYLFAGSLMLGAGILPLSRRIGGSRKTRFLTLFSFFFVAFAVSTSIESAIYSSVSGYYQMIIVFVLPVLLASLVSVLLTYPEVTEERFGERRRAFFGKRASGEWWWRTLLAVLSFPVVYLVFGIAVSPLVAGYYQGLDYGLTIPGIGIIIGVQLLRSLLFLLVTLPVMILWLSRSRQLILLLGIAHFVFVFAYDIVLAYQLPFELVAVHGLEILLDSFVYSWIIVTLLYAAKDNHG